MLDRTTTPADELLSRITMAVALANDAEKKRQRAIGELLLELKQRYPNKPKEFEAKLTEVSGLRRSRAYDYMALAGGRKTEEALREEARLRKEKERERKAKEKNEREKKEREEAAKALKGAPFVTVGELNGLPIMGQRKPESVTVTDERTKAKQQETPVTKASALDEFRFAARNWIPKMSAVDRQKALKLVTELVNGRTAK
jgi:hypothetical protein